MDRAMRARLRYELNAVHVVRYVLVRYTIRRLLFKEWKGMLFAPKPVDKAALLEVQPEENLSFDTEQRPAFILAQKLERLFRLLKGEGR